jgi:hypothetical protein
MDRTTQLAPLGLQRIRVLECLGGNDPKLPGYLELAAEADVLAALRSHVVRLCDDGSAETDPNTIRLLAAARFLTGDLGSAYTIIDRLPARPFELDHGAGICLVVPFYALRTALPLPVELSDVRRWTADTREQVALQDWLSAHEQKLRWVETTGIYELA